LPAGLPLTTEKKALLLARIDAVLTQVAEGL
jgi:hypothetical protein